MRYRQIIFLILLIGSVVGGVSADVSAYGGVLQNYTNVSGNGIIETRANIPLTVENVAYPEWLFEILAAAGLVFLGMGIVFVARSDNVPSIAILTCGILAFGIFLTCAMMAPYVATITTTHDIIHGYNGSEIPVIYISQSTTYLLSPWVAYACWGGALAGLIFAIAGTLSFFGVFHRKGIKDASKGKYLETDVTDDEPLRNGKY